MKNAIFVKCYLHLLVCQVALLRRLIQEEIGSIVQNYNEEQEQELDDLWQEFEDSFK